MTTTCWIGVVAAVEAPGPPEGGVAWATELVRTDTLAATAADAAHHLAG